MEIEGLRGAVTWDWWETEPTGRVTYTFDGRDGFEQHTTTFGYTDPLGLHDKPLAYFIQRVRGEDSPAVVNERAVFNFSCFRAIYDCAATGQPQRVEYE